MVANIYIPYCSLEDSENDMPSSVVRLAIGRAVYGNCRIGVWCYSSSHGWFAEVDPTDFSYRLRCSTEVVACIIHSLIILHIRRLPPGLDRGPQLCDHWR